MRLIQSKFLTVFFSDPRLIILFSRNTEVTNAKAAETKLTEEKAQLQKQIEQLNAQLQEAQNKVKTLEAAKPAAEAKTETKKEEKKEEVTQEAKKDDTTAAA